MKSKAKKDVRTRTWMAIFYPDSAPSDWEEILSERLGHGPWAHSPLHDKDVNPDGTVKKPHWHVVMTFPGKKSYEQVKDILEPLNCTEPKRLESLNGMIRYFIHADNPEKAPYSRADIKAFGGLDVITPFENTQAFIEDNFSAIFDIIVETRLDNLIELETKLREEGKEELLYFIHTHTIVVTKYLDHQYQLNKRQGYNYETGEIGTTKQTTKQTGKDGTEKE